MTVGQNLLAIETSSLAGSVALCTARGWRGVRMLDPRRRHAAELFPAIASLLEEAGLSAGQINAAAFSCGPGSFTGIRIAAAAARTLQSTTGCRVVAVPSLEVIAAGSISRTDTGYRIVVLRDARRGQVYASAFIKISPDELRCTTGPEVVTPADWLPTIDPPVIVTGDGVEEHRDLVARLGLRVADPATWAPRAEIVARIAVRMADRDQFCERSQILPTYIRPPECEEVYAQRREEAIRKRSG